MTTYVYHIAFTHPGGIGTAEVHIDHALTHTAKLNELASDMTAETGHPVNILAFSLLRIEGEATGQ